MLDALTFISTEGFTGHEPLDRTGVIHMNGRIYDPTLGRFLNADPIVQSPENSQSHNRYSYVQNSPLSAIDPTGFTGCPLNDTGEGCVPPSVQIPGSTEPEIVFGGSGGGGGQGNYSPTTIDIANNRTEGLLLQASLRGDRGQLSYSSSQKSEILSEIRSAIKARFGTPFESEDEAARYLHSSLYDLSVKFGIEIGARIYKHDGAYFISKPYTDFLPHEVTSRSVPELVESRFAGSWHTHPAWDSDPSFQDFRNRLATDRQYRTTYVSLRRRGVSALLAINPFEFDWRKVE